MRRLSMTVMSPNRRRPSGTSAMPAATIRCGASCLDRPALEQDAAAGPRPHQTGDGLEQRRLAGAVGAEDHRGAAGLDIEGDVVQRLVLAVGDADVLKPQHRRLRGRRASPSASDSTRSGVPSAIFSPAFITTTRSHRARIASMTCSIMTMVMPSPRIWRIRSMPILQLGRVEAGQPFVEQQELRAASRARGQARGASGRCR